MALAPGGGLMMAGTICAFAGICIVLVRVFELPDYGVLLVVGIGVLGLGLIRRLARRRSPPEPAERPEPQPSNAPSSRSFQAVWTIVRSRWNHRERFGRVGFLALLSVVGIGVVVVVTVLLLVAHRQQRDAFCRAWATRPMFGDSGPVFTPALYKRCLAECATWADGCE
jgi:hypothetical protein